jgi:hypothetical protein
MRKTTGRQRQRHAACQARAPPSRKGSFWPRQRENAGAGWRHAQSRACSARGKGCIPGLLSEAEEQDCVHGCVSFWMRYVIAHPVKMLPTSRAISFMTEGRSRASKMKRDLHSATSARSREQSGAEPRAATRRYTRALGQRTRPQARPSGTCFKRKFRFAHLGTGPPPASPFARLASSCQSSGLFFLLWCVWQQDTSGEKQQS